MAKWDEVLVRLEAKWPFDIFHTVCGNRERSARASYAWSAGGVEASTCSFVDPINGTIL